VRIGQINFKARPAKGERSAHYLESTIRRLRR
jgi:hypothetical protein